MDEDEEVIREGSSLYNHLKETGYEDFEVASIEHKYYSYENNDITEAECSIWMLKQYFTKLFGIKKLWTMIGGFDDIGKEVFLPLSSKLLKAKFLEEEDLIILESLSASIQELSSQLLENSETLDKDYCFSNVLWNKFNCYEIFPLSLAFILFVAVTMSFLAVTALSALCFLFVGLTIVIIIRIFHIYMNLSCLKKLNELLILTQDANQMSAKCLRYLFEMDIFKRGLGQKNLSNVENDFEESLCYGLSHLQSSLFSYFKSLRNEALTYSSKISHVGNIPILFNKRYECFDFSTSSESTFVKAKAEKSKVSSVISAFWTETYLLSETLGTLRLFNAVSWKELENLKQQTKLLEKNLNLSKNFWLEEKSNLKHLIDSPKSYEKLKTDVTGAVNILSIKCRLLAHYSMHLQEKLVNYDNDDNLPYDYVRETCNEIRNHILSCSASLEDVLERTENSFSDQFGSPTEKKHEHDETKEFNDKKSDIISLSNTQINLNDLEPHVIQDEVFEAVVEENQSRSLSFDGDEEWLQNLKQEKQMKKKQKDRCRRVLQEIQPILHKRRRMWEERESKALHRMRNIKDDEDESLNTKESDSGVSSPLEIPNVCFEKDTSTSKLMSLYGSSVKSVLDEGHDYDSEEERLLVYKRVKRELDEDEEKRRRENITDTEDEEEENYQERKNFLKLPLKLSSENMTELNDIKEMSLSTSLQSDLKVSCYSSEISAPGEDGSFSCGESSDDDHERIIDWSMCGFRNSKSLENDNPNSKASLAGFSLPPLNKEATKPPPLVEEIFGGFGEGESDAEESCSDLGTNIEEETKY